jgi:hypothetical protein
MARNKYGARKVKADGHTFDSQLEYARYQQLKLLERAGEITGLVVHPKYKLTEGYTRPRSNKKIQGVTYTADFSYVDLQQNWIVVEDIKSPPTAKKEGFILRRKLFEDKYDIPITVLMKDDIL